MIYVFEWIISFFIIWGLYFLLIKIFLKKFNFVTSVIFSFIVIGIFSFLISEYFMTFKKPSLIYLPFLIFFLIFYIYKEKRK
jgi:hypothetical protein